MNRTLAEYSAGRILWRIENDETGPVVDERGQFVHVKPEIALFPQLNRNRAAAHVVDHGLIYRESGVGINNFIPLIH